MIKEYNISKAAGQCCQCSRELASGEEFMATLKETQDDFLRHDYCLACWKERGDNPESPDMIAIWRSRVAQPQEKKRLFVDDDLLVNFFERLDGSSEPAKVSFRFVLALVLMRKKRLVYDGSEKAPDGLETWKMHFKGSDTAHRVIDPHLDEDKIAQVSQHLGEILEGEL